MFSEDALQRVVALTGVALTQDDLKGALDEVTRLTAQALPDCDGASLTMLEDGNPAVGASSNDWARELDHLQFEEREGPCLDASRTGQVFRVRDLSSDNRWPFFGPRAAEAGARSVVSFPMASEGKAIGALNAYSKRADAFPSEVVALGELIAAQASMATLVASSYFRHRSLGDQLRQALQSRAVIEQAKGILMAARRCTEQQAFDALVQLSQTSNRKLRDVAQALVDEASSA